jgi:hypothetical protein
MGIEAKFVGHVIDPHKMDLHNGDGFEVLQFWVRVASTSRRGYEDVRCEVRQANSGTDPRRLYAQLYPGIRLGICGRLALAIWNSDNWHACLRCDVTRIAVLTTAELALTTRLG